MLTCTKCGHKSVDLVEHIIASHGGEDGLAAYIAEHGGDTSSVILEDLDDPTPAPTPAPRVPTAAPRRSETVKIAGMDVKKTGPWSATLKHYIPKVNEAYAFQDFTADVLKDVELARPVLLIGHTGTGKTSCIEQVAARIEQPTVRVNLNQQTTAQDFVGFWSAQGGNMVWVDGVLPHAMRNGLWLIIDEMDYGEPSILAALNAVLERGGQLVLKEKGGEVVVPAEGFRIFATGNAIGCMAQYRHLYQGTNLMNEAQLDRWRTYLVDYMPEATEAEVLKNSVPLMTINVAKELVKVATMVRKSFLEEQVSCTFSTRRLIDWGEMIMRYKALKADSPFKAAQATIFSKISKEDAMVIDGYMRRVLLGNTTSR